MWLCSSVYSEKTMTDLFVTAVACSPNLISAKAWQRRSKKRHAGRALPVSVSAPLLCAGLGFSVSAWRMMSRSNRCDSHILLVRTPRRCCISIFKKEKKKKTEWKTKQHILAVRPGQSCVRAYWRHTKTMISGSCCWRVRLALFVFRNQTPEGLSESTNP